MDLEPGALLVASADLLDPNFARSVVLVLEHNDEGALGVVLNRPARRGSPQQPTDPASEIFAGGPVEPSARIVVGLMPGSEDGAPRWQAAVGDEVDLTPVLAEFAGGRSRVFAGYAGWGAGQLEAEIDEGAWHLVLAESEDMVCAHPDRLWADVLRRQPEPLSWQATRPVEPGWN